MKSNRTGSIKTKTLTAALIFLSVILIIACTSKLKETVAADDVSIKTDQTTMDKAGKIDPPPGGISLSELMDNKEKYNGQKVKVRGKCIKFNENIMGVNWAHIQDGSLAGENEDLTVTTTENVSTGSIVSFEGVIALNKDFGSGYKYDIIMEKARLLP